VDPEVPDALIGDPGRLRQIVVNLIGNAIKFTERGEVVVRVEVESRDEASVNLHFAVSDTGIGIPRDKLDRLFRAFSQVDASTTRKYGGTGLGLAISSQLVQMMGGRIWLESEPGRGSTFHFAVRFGLSERIISRCDARPERIHGLSVLIVDDNATNRRILQEMLANWRMKPVAVDGGAAALDALSRARANGEPFPLVLLDSMMPEMDGFTLAERIQQDPALVGATLMMLSSADRRGDAARCRQLGVSAFLVKPVRQSELLDAIMTVLGSDPGIELRQLPAGYAITQAAVPLRLLLAEDNAVNQRLAVRLLEKRGHSVTVVNNGRQAIESLFADPPSGGAPMQVGFYDVVLMDVQMPEMDGFEATSGIRSKEKAATGGRIPIVAMTAHAMKGDRERCLAAGMDGYVSKPLQPSELFAAVESLAQGGVPGTASARIETHGAMFDRKAALHRVGGDVALLKELVEVFCSECPAMVREIEHAIERSDASRLRRAAHALKGSVGNFGASEVVTAAQHLELDGRDNNLADAAGHFTQLRLHLDRLLPTLRSIVN
jgi:CheY-like chemotaxis protein/HPt (histidine-containing phosphotransfer) domain-containing protein